MNWTPERKKKITDEQTEFALMKSLWVDSAIVYRFIYFFEQNRFFDQKCQFSFPATRSSSIEWLNRHFESFSNSYIVKMWSLLIIWMNLHIVFAWICTNKNDLREKMKGKTLNQCLGGNYGASLVESLGVSVFTSTKNFVFVALLHLSGKLS